MEKRECSVCHATTWIDTGVTIGVTSPKTGERTAINNVCRSCYITLKERAEVFTQMKRYFSLYPERYWSLKAEHQREVNTQ